MKPILVPIREFCELVRVGRTKAYQLINAGELKTVKIGRRTLITMSSIEDMIDRSAAGVASQ